MEKKVSIIVPVYNSEKYLSRCLDSIINQTSDNFELIIINDGSKDNSQRIIDEYKEKYSDKIVVINQENHGVAYSRNYGIEIAKNEYIMFIDNDDYIDNNYVEVFLNEICKENYDIVIGGYKRPDLNENIIEEVKLNNNYKWSKYKILTPWARIFKKEYLLKNDIKFLKTSVGEDLYFNLLAYLNTDKIKVIEYVGYNWFFNAQSVSNTNQRDYKKIDPYMFLNESYNKLKEKKLLNKEYDYLMVYYMCFINWYLSFAMFKAEKKEFFKEYVKIFEWFKERFPKYWKNKQFKLFYPKGEKLNIRIFTTIIVKTSKYKFGKYLFYLYIKVLKKLKN